jgi:hypothetical protein
MTENKEFDQMRDQFLAKCRTCTKKNCSSCQDVVILSNRFEHAGRTMDALAIDSRWLLHAFKESSPPEEPASTETKNET